jgi:hypothetical protein
MQGTQCIAFDNTRIIKFYLYIYRERDDTEIGNCWFQGTCMLFSDTINDKAI